MLARSALHLQVRECPSLAEPDCPETLHKQAFSHLEVQATTERATLSGFRNLAKMAKLRLGLH
jgi:hypothetical protein